MTYEEFVKLKRRATGKQTNELIRFASRNPAVYVRFMARYQWERNHQGNCYLAK